MTESRSILSRLFRRAARLAVMGALLGGAVQCRPAAQKEDAQAATPGEEKAKALRLMRAAPPGAYAEDRSRLQNDMDRAFQKPHRLHSRVIVLDTDRYDIGISAGLPPEDAVRELLEERGYAAIPGQKLRAIVEEDLGDSKLSPRGLFSAYVAPTAHSIPDDKVCIIVPSAGNNFSSYPHFSIRGFDDQTTLAYTNAHEGWHCRDDVYDIREIEKHEPLLNPKNLDVNYSKPGVAEALSLLYKKEALADAGALGDMIRAGQSPEILETVAAWRMEKALGDPFHNSAPVLRALKRAIEKTGVENFRAMSGEEAEKLYIGKVEELGLGRVGAMRAFLTDIHGSDADRQALQDRAPRDPDTRRGIAMARTPFPDWEAGAKDNAKDKAVAAEVANWNAIEALQEKTAELGRNGTPLPVVGAYTALQRDLREKMKAEPLNAVYTEKAAKLRTVFMSGQVLKNFAAFGMKAPAPRP